MNEVMFYLPRRMPFFRDMCQTGPLGRLAKIYVHFYRHTCLGPHAGVVEFFSYWGAIQADYFAGVLMACRVPVFARALWAQAHLGTVPISRLICYKTYSGGCRNHRRRLAHP